MASFSRKTGIIGALAIAGVLIAGAYILSGPGLSLFRPNTANAESTTLLLQEYAAKDSDHDGLPDWEEALYGTDPNNPHSISPTLTDGQEVAEGLIKPKFMTETPSDLTSATTLPGTTPADNSLTDQFSQSLMSQYLSQSSQSDGTPPSEEDVATFAEGAMQEFAQSHEQQDLYNHSQLQVSGSGPDALRTYAGSMDQAFAISNHGPQGSESELDYFSDAVEKNDSQALTQVAAIGKSYSDLATAIMQVPVPTEAQYAHLEIANSAARLGGDITDMSFMNTDPLRAYLGLAQYQADTTSLANALSDMASVFSNENVSLEPGDAGYYFYHAALKVEAQVSAASSTDSGN